MQDLPQTRHSLIVRLKTSSDDAWAEFLQVYEQAIYRFCRSRGLQEADAKDVTQEVFAALHQRIETWEVQPDRGSFRGWLFRVARNIAVDRIRDRSRSPVSAEAHLADVAETPDADQTAFGLEYRRSLFQWAAERVRDEVKESTWLCFWRTAVDNQSPTQAAKELRVNVGTLYTAKCRVMARIREKIAQLSVVDDDPLSDLDRWAGENFAGTKKKGTNSDDR